MVMYVVPFRIDLMVNSISSPGLGVDTRWISCPTPFNITKRCSYICVLTSAVGNPSAEQIKQALVTSEHRSLFTQAWDGHLRRTTPYCR